MSPDELRAAAAEMDEWVNPNGAFDICRDATRRLADVIEYTEDMYGGEGMGEYLVDCDAGSVWSIARGDTTNRENRSE